MEDFLNVQKTRPEWLPGMVADVIISLFDANHFELAVKIADLVQAGFGELGDYDGAIEAAQDRHLERADRAVGCLVRKGVGIDEAIKAVRSIGLMFDENA